VRLIRCALALVAVQGCSTDGGGAPDGTETAAESSTPTTSAAASDTTATTAGSAATAGSGTDAATASTDTDAGSGPGSTDTGSGSTDTGDPGHSEWPDDSNTGVPDGVRLMPCATPIDTPGTYDACLWEGGLTITTHDVTITRSRVVGRVDLGYDTDAVYNIVLEDSEIDGNNVRASAIGSIAFVGRRLKIHSAQVLVWTSGPEFLLEDSYLYDLYGTEDDHCGGVTGTPLEGELRHNTLFGNLSPDAGPFGADGGVSAAITAYTHGDFWPPLDGLLVEHNQIQSADAYYAAYAGGTGEPGEATNVRYIENVFVRVAPGEPAAFGGNITAFHEGYGNLIDGNIYDTGEPIEENDLDGNGQ
jgi:hypothetical protein